MKTCLMRKGIIKCYSQRMNQKTIQNSYVQLKGHVSKEELNQYGVMHGGRLLTLCDEVGYLAAMKHAKTDCLTRGAHNIEFLKVLREGEPYHIDARVIQTGRTTLWVSCVVKSKQKQVMRAVFVYIAVDSNFKPQPVANIAAENEAERQEQASMQQLINRVKA